jgi:trehalose 6-phosphate phosphatase
VRESLTRLTRLAGTTIAIVSGRTLTDLAPLAAVPGAWLVGYHGAEIRRPNDDEILRRYPASGDLALPGHLANRVLDFARNTPGVRVELKPAGVALHWRDNGRSEAPLGIALLEEALETLRGPRIRLVRGRCLLELSALGADKGWALAAVRREIQPFPVLTCYLGDDLTDEDVFRTIQPDGIGILVADDSSRRERPGPTAADYTLPGPVAVEAFLRELAALRTRSPGIQKAAAGGGEGE